MLYADNTDTTRLKTLQGHEKVQFKFIVAAILKFKMAATNIIRWRVSIY